MKFEHNWGDSWRGIFKKLLWFSVFAFEITAVVLIYLFVTGFVRDTSAHVGLIIMFSLVATLFNSIIHSVWGCIAYMFEDIARTREVTCAMAEYTIERDKLLHPEIADRANDEAPKQQPATSNGTVEKKVYRSIADRANDDAPASETWTCPDCGRENASTATFCKDCGRYK